MIAVRPDGGDDLDLVHRRGDGDEVLVGVTRSRQRAIEFERLDGALPEAAGHRHGADVGLAKLGEDLAGEMPALKAVDQHELLLAPGAYADWRRTSLVGMTRRLDGRRAVRRGF